MNISQENIDWLLDSDPVLKWQVERDLLQLPENIWASTRQRLATEGFASKVLALQDEDGQWAGGSFFPGRDEPRAITHEDDSEGQPYIATTWSLNLLRDFGLDAKVLGDTAQRIEANCRWDYDNLPYWDGEVDCCINSYTLANGAWLGQDVSKIAQWFIEHQLDDGGWNCQWTEGSTRSSFHSTLNSLVGILHYEEILGKDEELTLVRKKAEEYLLERELMFKLSTKEEVGPWVREFGFPFRWRYSALRALNYFRDASVLDTNKPDSRLAKAVEVVRNLENQNGRWVTGRREKGSVWFEVDSPVGEESKWLTFYALRALNWWDNS